MLAWSAQVIRRLVHRIRKPKRLLFYRDVSAYYGGHQKVANYLEHLQASLSFAPSIYFSKASRWDEANPWHFAASARVQEYLPHQYDYVFLGGMDWLAYLNAPRPHNQPVINLIQHLRHADPAADVHQFLSEPAIRICVSPQVSAAILATGKVNGPVITIENGLEMPVLKQEKTWDVIILGLKNPALACAIRESLQSTTKKILILDQWIAREKLHHYMASSRMAVLLPHMTEGFYLPALEAMHFCDLVVVPDAIGNRSFCQHGVNCLMPDYNETSLIQAIASGFEILSAQEQLKNYKIAAKKTVSFYSLQRERQAFLTLMKQVDALWHKHPFITQ
jgi:glycosyltransferase involved in cell wall biosynthesis